MLVALVAGVGFFALSFYLLAIEPGQRLDATMRADAPASYAGYSGLELEGRRVYATNGCAYCHTQQVRFLEADNNRWGPPTEAWETRFDYPQLWGTRRIGPDLAREAGVRSADWQSTHLLDPRSIVPDSVMPAYSWLFDRRPDQPNAEGRALLAYLRSLGRARAAAPRPPRQPTTGMPGMIIAPDAGAGRSGDSERLPANAAQPLAALQRPPVTSVGIASPPSALDGGRLFRAKCAGCHGQAGDGAGPGAHGLLPRPTDLRSATYSDAALLGVLWNGRLGSSMPAWRDLSAGEAAAITRFVQGLAREGEAERPAGNDELAAGALLYAHACVACHGEAGRGNGVAAGLYFPRPANFSQFRPDRRRILRALDHGVPGSAMPAFPGFSASERTALVSFVRSIYRPTAP
ncbi:MAG: cbb3-type cytochrome c oxidase subunit II [Caldimonas sp.]